MIIATEIVVTSIAILAFGLLLVLVALRLRSREAVIFHLALHIILGLLLGVTTLFDLLSVSSPLGEIAFDSMAQFFGLAMVLSLGALTLNFLRKEWKLLISYWVISVLILILWTMMAVDGMGWQTAIISLTPAGSPSPTLILAGLGWLGAIATAFSTLTIDLRKRHSAQYKNKLRYWLVAVTLWAGSGVVFFAAPAFWVSLGLLMLTVGSVLASYTVLSYHTPDLQQLMNRALRYFGVTAILSAVYLLGLAVMITLSNRGILSAAGILLLSVVVAIAFAVIFPPLSRLSHKLLTRIFIGKQSYDQKQVITHYSQSISTALDMKRLGDTVINLMIETLGIEQGIVFVNERSGAGDVALRPLSSIGVGELTTGHFPTDSPFLDYFRKGKKSLSQYDIDVLPEFRILSDQERQWLSGLGMELYIPILRQRDMVGLLGFGPQPQGTAYYDEDLDLMMALADQTALAMDSARLFEQLALINQEVGLLSDQLAGADESKSDFLSIASHELRTPLTQIHGYSQMLLDLTEEELRDPSYMKNLIEGVVKGSERMKGLVDLMFDVTEADVGEMRLFKGQVYLEDVIDQAAEPFIQALDERRIAFGKSGIKELPIVEADGTRLVQAFENLIGNAIKYTPDGGTITIEGRACTIADIGPAAEIIVADTGIGIDLEHHEKIFEKFFRVDDTLHHSTGKTKFKGAGPGLGLTLVRGIAEAHGGRTWVESLGHDEVNLPGSKFFFLIPMTQSAEDEEEKPKQSQIETRHWRRSDMEEMMGE
jgi:signal transduction histidine kinase